MKNAEIENVTILTKVGDTITKIAIKYVGKKKINIIEDAGLVPLIMLFWVAKCAGVGSLIQNPSFQK